MTCLEGIDEAIKNLIKDLEEELTVLRENGGLSADDDVDAGLKEIPELAIKVRCLLDSGRGDRFNERPDFTIDDWALIAAYWIIYINTWSLHRPFLTLGGVLNDRLQELLIQRDERVASGETKDVLTVLMPLIRLLLGGLPAFPWEKTWLLPSAIQAIPWVEEEKDWITFAISEQDRIRNADERGNSISRLLSSINYRQTMEQKYRFYIEDWLYRHEFSDIVQAGIRSENESAAPAKLVNELSISGDENEDEEPDEEVLAAMEDGRDPDVSGIPGYGGLDDLDDPEKILDDFDPDEDDDKGLADQVKTHPFLLEGKFPESLGEGLNVYEHALLQAMGESLLIPEEDLLSLSKEELIERLIVTIPERLRSEMRIHNGTDATLLYYLLERNGALVNYERAMMLNDMIEKGYIFLFDRPSGYRVYITAEIEKLLLERPLEDIVEEAKLFTLISNVATALVNRLGVVKMEDVVELVNNEYHDTIKSYSFSELRRLIRSNLELHEKEGLAGFSFRRPYVYNESVDYQTALVIREYAEANHTKARRLRAKDIRASLMPPFTADNAAWFSFLELISDDINTLEWELQEDVLRYLALLTAQETDLNIIVELLAEMDVDIEDVKHLEQILRAYADYANTSPIWRLGGYSLKELNMTKSYEDRMAESINRLNHQEHGHDHDDHHHDHHEHEHHHH